jgi:hypothetical protein
MSREVHTLWVYEGRLLASTGFRGYVNWNDKTLSSKFENHALEDQEIRALEKLVHHMKKGSKVRARNVVCLALGSLLDRSRTQRNRSLQQFTVLLKVVELLGMILNLDFSRGWKCRKRMTMLIPDRRNLTLLRQNHPRPRLHTARRALLRKTPLSDNGGPRWYSSY